MNNDFNEDEDFELPDLDDDELPEASMTIDSETTLETIINEKLENNKDDDDLQGIISTLHDETEEFKNTHYNENEYTIENDDENTFTLIPTNTTSIDLEDDDSFVFTEDTTITDFDEITLDNIEDNQTTILDNPYDITPEIDAFTTTTNNTTQETLPTKQQPTPQQKTKKPRKKIKLNNLKQKTQQTITIIKQKIQQEIGIDENNNKIQKQPKTLEKNPQPTQPQEETNEEQEETPENNPAQKPKTQPLKKTLNLLLTPHNYLVRITTILLTLIGNPLINTKPLRFLKKLLFLIKPIRKIILNTLPYILIITIIITINQKSIPSKTQNDLPDNGQIQITNMHYTPQTQEFHATITNTGDTILKTKITPQIYTTTLNKPITWIKPQKTGQCNTKNITIDIETNKQITIKCTQVKGLFPKAATHIK